MKSADKLDHTIEQTFPASDPPANTVVTGVRVGPSAEFVVRDNPEHSRLETEVAGQLATLRYERHPHAVVLVETDVPRRAPRTRRRQRPGQMGDRDGGTRWPSRRRRPVRSCGRTCTGRDAVVSIRS
jgi:hypothetical protein